MSKYDPSKEYYWTPEDKFILTGEDFGIILNTFRDILSTPEAQKILKVNEANKTIEKIIAEAVKKDIVKERKEAPK